MSNTTDLDRAVAEALRLDPWPWSFTDEDGCPHDRLPAFSEEVVSAIDALERYATEAFHFTFEPSEVSSRQPYRWIVEGHDSHALGTADTLPLAICRAILAAEEARDAD